MLIIIGKIRAGTRGPAVTNAIIHRLAENPFFQSRAEHETRAITRRDAEDEEKLREGIALALAKGQLRVQEKQTRPFTEIAADNKSPEAVVAEIRSLIRNDGAPFSLAIAGNSGTGKGTGTDFLCTSLPRTVSWSNGNIFRSLVFLFLETEGEAAFARVQDYDFSALLSRIRLSFTQSAYDLALDMGGSVLSIAEIRDSVLKESRIAARIPSLARCVQGEVIHFTAAAFEQFRRHGLNTIIEGRRATLDYIPTDYRINLVLQDPQIIGQRRAAQKIAALLSETKKDFHSDEDILHYISKNYS